MLFETIRLRIAEEFAIIMKMLCPEAAAWIHQLITGLHIILNQRRDGKLVDYTISRPEWGEDFYAPQTFCHHGRRIMIGWMYHWGKTAPEGCPYAGALSIPRELRREGNAVYNYPEEEVRHLLKSASAYVRTEDNTLFLKTIAGEWTERQLPAINSVEILEDTKSVEVFVNGGEFSFTHWLV